VIIITLNGFALRILNLLSYRSVGTGNDFLKFQPGSFFVVVFLFVIQHFDEFIKVNYISKISSPK
jgi:hypothetical protein